MKTILLIGFFTLCVQLLSAQTPDKKILISITEIHDTLIDFETDITYAIPNNSTIKDSKRIGFSLDTDTNCKLISVKLFNNQGGELMEIQDEPFASMLLQYSILVKYKNVIVDCRNLQSNEALKSAVARVLRTGFLEP